MLQKSQSPQQLPLVFKTKYNTHFAWKYIGQALLKHWNIIKKKVRLKMVFPKPPLIAYSRSENLRDSLVKAKTPYQGEEWLHVWRPCEKWGRSIILTNPAHISRSGSGEQRFQHVHRFWWNRGKPKYTRSYNRRQDHEDHSSRPFRAHTHGKKKHTRQIWTLIYVPKHYNEGLHPQEHMITKRIAIERSMHATFPVHSILRDKILEVPNKWASDKLLMKGYRILFT